MGHVDRSRGDRGSGSVLALGLVAAVIGVTAGGLVVVGASAAQARAAAAADLSALAAADVAVGLTPGVPCAAADEVARHNGAALDRCAQRGVEVTVGVSAPYLGLTASASARAGPAGER
jgi:secretion/DNA translocation related TadE-like protein